VFKIWDGKTPDVTFVLEKNIGKQQKYVAITAKGLAFARTIW
jgi:hypothetical protein